METVNATTVLKELLLSIPVNANACSVPLVTNPMSLPRISVSLVQLELIIVKLEDSVRIVLLDSIVLSRAPLTVFHVVLAMKTLLILMVAYLVKLVFTKKTF